MERQPLLGPRPDARFWVSVRRALLLLFWVSMAALLGAAIALLVRAYEPPPPSKWHQRRVICRNTGAPAAPLTGE